MTNEPEPTNPNTTTDLPRRDPPRCPYCDRVMTYREKDEQGACNDCANAK